MELSVSCPLRTQVPGETRHQRLRTALVAERERPLRVRVGVRHEHVMVFKVVIAGR